MLDLVVHDGLALGPDLAWLLLVHLPQAFILEDPSLSVPGLRLGLVAVVFVGLALDHFPLAFEVEQLAILAVFLDLVERVVLDFALLRPQRMHLLQDVVDPDVVAPGGLIIGRTLSPRLLAGGPSGLLGSPPLPRVRLGEDEQPVVVRADKGR